MLGGRDTRREHFSYNFIFYQYCEIFYESSLSVRYAGCVSPHTGVFSHLLSIFLWIQKLLIRFYEVNNLKLSIQVHSDASVIARHSHIFPM